MKPIIPPVFPWKDHTKYTYPLGLDINGVCFLSGNSASEYDAQANKIVVKGDLTAQIDTALAKIRAVLEAAGLSLADVISVIQYVTPQAFASIQNIPGILESYGVSGAAIHTVPVNRLMRREALIELEVVAAGRDQKRKIVQTPAAIRVFSEPNDFVFVGEGFEPDEHGSDASLESEIRRVERLLEGMGTGWKSVGRCRLMLASVSSSEVDEAVGALKKRIPDLPVMPAVGVVQLPAGRAHISVEICASSGKAEPSRTVHGGLVRRFGSCLMATGLQSRDGTLSLVEQVEDIYSSIVPEVLAEAGMEIRNTVQTVEWVTEDVLPDYRQTGTTRRNLLREPFPVASGLVCSALPNGRKVSVDIVAWSD